MKGAFSPKTAFRTDRRSGLMWRCLRTADGSRVVRLARGRLANWDAEALAVSAGPYLEGMSRASLWRKGRLNADDVHTAGGQSLASAATQLSASIGRPLEFGTAVASDAGCALTARWVVHCVAPDARMAHHEAGAVLQRTFSAAFATASAIGARSLALPAIGSDGMQGFAPGTSGEAAFCAAAEWLRDGSCGTSALSRLRRIDLVVDSDVVWASWHALAEHHLGLPDPGDVSGDGMRLTSWSWARGMRVYKPRPASPRRAVVL